MSLVSSFLGHCVVLLGHIASLASDPAHYYHYHYIHEVAWSVCLSVCWSHSWAFRKWLNRSRCRLGSDSCEPKEACIRWGWRSDEYICRREGWQHGDAAFRQNSLTTCYYYRLLPVILEWNWCAVLKTVVQLNVGEIFTTRR